MDMKNAAERMKNGDESALDDIIRLMSPFVTSVISYTASGYLSQADIEETAADVFITLWYNRDRAAPEKLQGFLCRIAKNKTVDRLRRQGRRLHPLSLEETGLEDILVSPDNLSQKELSDLLREALLTLEEKDREIMIRFYYYHQSTPVISEQMDINKSTVQTKLRRSREKLKNYLTERGVTL